MELAQCFASLSHEDRQRVAELPVRDAIKAIATPKSTARPATLSTPEVVGSMDVVDEGTDHVEIVRNAIDGLEQLASALAGGHDISVRALKTLGQKVKHALRVIFEVRHQPH
jgi:hypothetical protein